MQDIHGLCFLDVTGTDWRDYSLHSSIHGAIERRITLNGRSNAILLSSSVDPTASHLVPCCASIEVDVPMFQVSQMAEQLPRPVMNVFELDHHGILGDIAMILDAMIGIIRLVNPESGIRDPGTE